MKGELQAGHEGDRVYIVCLNPRCMRGNDRCLTTRTLHEHPSDCSQFYYPADQITARPWQELEKYPIDSLGVAARRKVTGFSERGYLGSAVDALRVKFEASMKELEEKIGQLYPENEFRRCYGSVYGLEKVAESLRLRRSPAYISQLISSNLGAQNYHALLRLNDNYDEMRNAVDAVGSRLLGSFDAVLQKHRAEQAVPGNRRVLAKKINYGIFKSKFVGSLKIQISNATVNFPKLTAISSFLPWIYTEKYFTEGTHEFKINSLRYPMVQNAGFTVLDEHDIDTYPYSTFKSLFNREGKGFKLLAGEEIDQFVAQTTVVTLRLELGSQPRAVIQDSEMQCQYVCELAERRAYRMGVYGCGWAMQVIELN